MCGRFGLFSSLEIIKKIFQLDDLPDFSPRYNIPPTSDIPAVWVNEKNERQMDLFRWGLVPFWSKEKPKGAGMINAKAETVFKKPAFRASMKNKRCLIPASGFYEWEKKGKDKQPYFFQPKNGELFAFAGLWDRWEGPEETIVSCTILTTEANDTVKPLHDRMPVIIKTGNHALWLDEEQGDKEKLKNLFIPFPSEEMVGYPVTKSMGKPIFDNPDCVKPINENGQEKKENQGSLFEE